MRRAFGDELTGLGLPVKRFRQDDASAAGGVFPIPNTTDPVHDVDLGWFGPTWGGISRAQSDMRPVHTMTIHGKFMGRINGEMEDSKNQNAFLESMPLFFARNTGKKSIDEPDPEDPTDRACLTVCGLVDLQRRLLADSVPNTHDYKSCRDVARRWGFAGKVHAVTIPQVESYRLGVRFETEHAVLGVHTSGYSEMKHLWSMRGITISKPTGGEELRVFERMCVMQRLDANLREQERHNMQVDLDTVSRSGPCGLWLAVARRISWQASVQQLHHGSKFEIVPVVSLDHHKHVLHEATLPYQLKGYEYTSEPSNFYYVGVLHGVARDWGITAAHTRNLLNTNEYASAYKDVTVDNTTAWPVYTQQRDIEHMPTAEVSLRTGPLTTYM